MTASRAEAEYRLTDPELGQLVVERVLPTGVTLGAGAYGSVEEVEIPGARVAAKKLHTQLINLGSSEKVKTWVTDFVKECKLMSQLRHPHIVQFLGVAYLPGCPIPVLLMEKLQTSLHNLLDTSPNIPPDIKVYLLTGTARGVVYLHSHTPPIAHRDLTARNILIDSGLTAKIADLGVARIVSIKPGQLVATMTIAPGNNLYMPPEAVHERGATRYNTAIDIFSFGVVSLFTLTQTFPDDLKPPTYKDPTTKRLIGRNEIERRREYIVLMTDSLGEAHPLVRLTVDCLEYDPRDRPSAMEVLRRLEGVGRRVPQKCSKTKLELVQRIQYLKKKSEEQLSERDAKHACEIMQFKAEKQDQVCGFEELISLQQQQLEVQRKAITQLSSQIECLESQLRETKAQRSTSLARRPVPAPRRKLSESAKTLSSITFNWRRCKDRPATIKHVLGQSLPLSGKLYVCCATTWSVLQYSPVDDWWAELPPPSVTDFTIATLKGQLLVVGGRESSTRKITEKIFTFQERSQQWAKCYPDMTTALMDPAILGYQDHLIVAGGLTSSQEWTANVNILDSTSNRWTPVAPVPNADSYFTVMVRDTVYLVGRDTQTLLRAPVVGLMLGAKSGVWEELTDTPYSYSSPVAIGNTLLTIGGRDKSEGSAPTSSIQMYDPTTDQWTRMGDLPQPMEYISCAVIQSEMFVFGNLFHSSTHIAKLTL